VLAAAVLLTACGGGDDDGGADAAGPATAPAATADPASTVAPARPVVGSPLGGPPATGDMVRFVTTTSTTTTLPPTTTSTSTTSTSSTSTSSTSTTTTVPAPTSIRCSFSADAVFEPGSAVLTATAAGEIVALVTDVDDVRSVHVEGHTDHRGTDADNLALSQARADAAKSALVDAGIDEAIITATGLGESDAHQGSPTDAEMAADRRVDVVIDATVPITRSC
jgi:outer membrane protein OmpA-like peptidoglycan-associated protein